MYVCIKVMKVTHPIKFCNYFRKFYFLPVETVEITRLFIAAIETHLHQKSK